MYCLSHWQVYQAIVVHFQYVGAILVKLLATSQFVDNLFHNLFHNLSIFLIKQFFSLCFITSIILPKESKDHRTDEITYEPLALILGSVFFVKIYTVGKLLIVGKLNSSRGYFDLINNVPSFNSKYNP